MLLTANLFNVRNRTERFSGLGSYAVALEFSSRTRGFNDLETSVQNLECFIETESFSGLETSGVTLENSNSIESFKEWLMSSHLTEKISDLEACGVIIERSNRTQSFTDLDTSWVNGVFEIFVLQNVWLTVHSTSNDRLLVFFFLMFRRTELYFMLVIWNGRRVKLLHPVQGTGFELAAEKTFTWLVCVSRHQNAGKN